MTLTVPDNQKPLKIQIALISVSPAAPRSVEEGKSAIRNGKNKKKDEET
jgi:hypothetical protein